MTDKHETVDAEVVPTQDIAVRPQSSVGQAMGVDDIIAQVTLIQSVMHKVMKEGEHYGTIPGCGDKKTLLQPGAQKLTMTFRLCPEYEIQEVNLDRGHKEYRIICTLKSMGNGGFVGQGVGCCSTMESKYRWRGGSRKCPKCGKEAIIKGKAEYGGGWLCFGKKGGCGAKWDDGAKEIEGQSVEKVENDNPADHYNTVLKMAKKRAFVDATITATAASDIFTQDIGDSEEEIPETEPKRHTPQSSQNAPRSTGTPPGVSQRSEAPAAAATTKPQSGYPTPAHRTKMLDNLKAHAGQESHKPVVEYFEKLGCLMPGEDIETIELRFVPASQAEMGALFSCVGNFVDGGDAVPAFDPHQEQNVPRGAKKPVEVPRDNTPTPKGYHHDEVWYDVIVPIPYKGQKRDIYLKNPDTIGSLYEARHGTDDEAAEKRKRLWGFCNHFEPKGWEKRDGTKMPPSDTDIKFREALDQFGEWFEKNHPDEKL